MGNIKIEELNEMLDELYNLGFETLIVEGKEFELDSSERNLNEMIDHVITENDYQNIRKAESHLCLLVGSLLSNKLKSLTRN